MKCCQLPRHHVTYAPAKLDVAHPMVKEKMHLQENTLFDLDLGGQGHKICCPVPSTSCDLCTYRVFLSYYVKWFRRRSIYKKVQYLTFDLDLGVKVTQNVAQYPQHHVTYAPAKFDIATYQG